MTSKKDGHSRFQDSKRLQNRSNNRCLTEQISNTHKKKKNGFSSAGELPKNTGKHEGFVGQCLKNTRKLEVCDGTGPKHERQHKVLTLR
jgi:hypothetical protein